MGQCFRVGHSSSRVDSRAMHGKKYISCLGLHGSSWHTEHTVTMTWAVSSEMRFGLLTCACIRRAGTVGVSV